MKKDMTDGAKVSGREEERLSDMTNCNHITGHVIGHVDETIYKTSLRGYLNGIENLRVLIPK